MAQFLLLNGPNLNRLGVREPDIYGHDTLEAIEARLSDEAAAAGHTLNCLQSNEEARLVDRIHRAADEAVDCAIFNPAAFTHTSIALRDALLATRLAFVEVHLSNTAAREPFRHHSYFADIAIGTITGFGPYGYTLALEAAMQHIDHSPRGT